MFFLENEHGHSFAQMTQMTLMGFKINHKKPLGMGAVFYQGL